MVRGATPKNQNRGLGPGTSKLGFGRPGTPKTDSWVATEHQSSQWDDPRKPPKTGQSGDPWNPFYVCAWQADCDCVGMEELDRALRASSW